MFRFGDSGGGHYDSATMAGKWTIAGTTNATAGPGGGPSIRDPNNIFRTLPNISGSGFGAGCWAKFRSSFAGGFLFEFTDGGSADGNRQVWLRIDTSGRLIVETIAFTHGTSTFTLSLGTEYYIEIFGLIDNSLGTATVRVKNLSTGVTETVLDLSGIDTQGRPTATWFGFRMTHSNVDVANLYVIDGSGDRNNSLLGELTGQAMLPLTDATLAGFNADLTPSTGTDHGTLVDETPPNTSDYNSADATGEKDTYQFPNLTSTGEIKAIQTLAYLWKTDQATKTVCPVLRTVGADYDGTAVAAEPAVTYEREVFELNPATSAPWIGQHINALQAGLKMLDASPASPTKWYLTNFAAPYTPATIRGTFDQTAGAVTKAIAATKDGGGTNTSVAIAETNVTDPFRVLLYRGVSGPLAAQTIAGTVDAVISILESAAAANMHWYLHLYVTQGDTDTPRGTLLANFSEALGVNEWPTAGLGTFKGLNAAAALSSLAITAGDRLVVEMGYISREASATSRTGTIRYGTIGLAGTAVPDVLDDGALAGTDVTAKAGYLVFSPGIAELGSAVSVRLSQMVVEVFSVNVPAVSDPPGGGDPGGSPVEPTNGTSICNAVVYKTVRVQTDSGEKRYSYGDVGISNTFREARVLSIGPIRRALSDINGRIETARTTIVLSDYDGTLAGLAASGVLLNKRVDVYAATDAQLRANATERRLASLIIRDFKFTGRKCSLQCEDYFGSILGEYGAAMLVPKRLFTTTDFPNIPVGLIGKPVPIGYGLLSDEDRGASAIGVVPAICVGARRLSDGLDWDEYVLFGHAAADWQSVFASDLQDVAVTNPASGGRGPRPVKMDLDAIEGTEFLVPTHSGWTSIVGSDPFVDHNGHRYAVIYVRGQRSLDARSGECPISVNVGGVEDVGDGSGTLIDDGWLQVQHFINNWWIQSYQTGNWFSIPTVNGVYSRIAALTFAAANEATAVRLGGSPGVGYRAAWMLGQDGRQHPIATAMAQLARDLDGEFGNDRHGRIIASVIDASAASVRTFTDVFQEIEERSFDANRRMANLNNAVSIKFIRNYIPDTRPDSARTGMEWWSDHNDYSNTVNLSDGTSVAAIQETRTLTLEGWSLRDGVTAADVGAQKLARRKDGPIYTQFRTSLCGDDVDVGDNFKVTSQEGLDASGWIAKLHRCEAITYYLDEDLVQLEGQVI